MHLLDLSHTPSPPARAILLGSESHPLPAQDLNHLKDSFGVSAADVRAIKAVMGVDIKTAEGDNLARCVRARWDPHTADARCARHTAPHACTTASRPLRRLDHIADVVKRQYEMLKGTYSSSKFVVKAEVAGSIAEVCGICVYRLACPGESRSPTPTYSHMQLNRLATSGEHSYFDASKKK